MSVRGSGMRKEVYCSSSRALCAQRAGSGRRSRTTRIGQELVAGNESSVVRIACARGAVYARESSARAAEKCSGAIR
jgi:hypothetical protein